MERFRLNRMERVVALGTLFGMLAIGAYSSVIHGKVTAPKLPYTVVASGDDGNVAALNGGIDALFQGNNDATSVITLSDGSRQAIVQAGLSKGAVLGYDAPGSNTVTLDEEQSNGDELISLTETTVDGQAVVHGLYQVCKGSSCSSVSVSSTAGIEINNGGGTTNNTSQEATVDTINEMTSIAWTMYISLEQASGNTDGNPPVPLDPTIGFGMLAQYTFGESSPANVLSPQSTFPVS